METVIDWLLGRKCVERKECEGIGLAIRTIEEFPGRTFRCPEARPKTSGISSEEILELIQQELPIYYDYTTRTKRYVSRGGISQVEIQLVGSLGIVDRYNPLDKTYHIAAEPPACPECQN
ncbi:MAG: hypothetical protein AMJ65_08785 [Phycisphaerae bacterium SG8_4]|nr:MAG: hypothetical protein AMJ65_08785 [Phycisphaerae bacterium SG8_4]